jgi:hypothetical protein
MRMMYKRSYRNAPSAKSHQGACALSTRGGQEYDGQIPPLRGEEWAVHNGHDAMDADLCAEAAAHRHWDVVECATHAQAVLPTQGRRFSSRWRYRGGRAPSRQTNG